MSNKYNEQQNLAWEVNHLLVKPGARKTFEDNLRVFSDWSKNWPKENAKLLSEHKELEWLIYDNIQESNKLHKRSSKLREALLDTRASLKGILDQLGTPEPSPWELIRDIPKRSGDEHITNLTKFMFGDTPAPKISPEQQSCRWYVRLSILHDKALCEEPKIIAEGVLDSEEVEITWWDSMQNDWDSWHPVIKFALEYVKTNLKIESQEKDGQSSSGGNISGMRWQDAQKKAERIVKESDYKGFMKLKEAVGCRSKKTLTKAIKNSPILTEAKSQYDTMSSTLKAVGLTQKVLVTYKEKSEGPQLTDIEVEEILAEMIQQVEEDKPAMLEETKLRIKNMNPTQKHDFAKTFQNEYKALKKHNRTHKDEKRTFFSEPKEPHQHKNV